jgi:hypothetical protein
MAGASVLLAKTLLKNLANLNIITSNWNTTSKQPVCKEISWLKTREK